MGLTWKYPRFAGLLYTALKEGKPSVDYGFTQRGKCNVDINKNENKATAAFEALCAIEANASLESTWTPRLYNGLSLPEARAAFSSNLFFGVRVNAEASGAVDDGLALKAAASFFAGLQVSCDGKLSIGSSESNLTVTGNATGTIGVEAKASAAFDANSDGFKAALKLSGFAGAKAEATGTVSGTLFGWDIFSVNAGASASVGIGADLSAEIEVTIQKMGASFSAGLTFGVGGDTSLEASVDRRGAAMALIELSTRAQNLGTTLRGYRSLNVQDAEWTRVHTDAVKQCNLKLNAYERELTKQQQIIRENS